MPWKECHVVDERVRFVARLLDGETMSARAGQRAQVRKSNGEQRACGSLR
jgi:hypothetical protein